jgi:hypothetical protein
VSTLKESLQATKDPVLLALEEKNYHVVERAMWNEQGAMSSLYLLRTSGLQPQGTEFSQEPLS